MCTVFPPPRRVGIELSDEIYADGDPLLFLLLRFVCLNILKEEQSFRQWGPTCDLFTNSSSNSGTSDRCSDGWGTSVCQLIKEVENGIEDWKEGWKAHTVGFVKGD